jgi:hypothetical protein
MTLFSSFRCALTLLLCSSGLGCALERSAKSACRTDRDCNAARVCSMSQCVAREELLDGSAARTGEREDGEVPATVDDDAEVSAGADAADERETEPNTCALATACATEAEACEDPDFDRLDGACTKRDDCAGVDACDPGECVDGVRTFTCRCPLGFIARGKACLPAADCPAFGCSGRCVSGLAKRACTCDGELVLASDDRSCKSGAWSEAMVLTESGWTDGAVALAVSRTGPAMVLFQQRVADVLELRARAFWANAWENETLLERKAYQGNIAVAIDDFGRSTAIFERDTPAGREQFWAHYSQRTWQQWPLLDSSVSGLDQPSNGEGLNGVKIAASGPGYVYAIWRHHRSRKQGGDTNAVYVNELAPDKEKTVARTLAPDCSMAFGANDLDISVEDSGVAAAVWTPAATGTEAPLATIDAFHDRAWSGPGLVDLGNASAPALRASVSSPGHTTRLVWMSNAGVYHRELAGDGTPTELIAPLTGVPGFVASASAGESVTALWTHRTDDGASLFVASASLFASTKVAGRWSAPSLLQSAPGLMFPSIRVVSDGSAVASWFQVHEGKLSMYLSRYAHAAESWSAPMRVNAEGTEVRTGLVGMDEGHRIMVAWSEATPGGTRVLVRRFE